MTKPSTRYTYAGAGVDIAAGDALVDAIKPHADTTRRRGVMAGLGGFGALFDLKAAGFTDPILVSGTDGVGTKIELARQLNRFDTIGIDLVAMCANDVLAQGGEPLFFLDYFATGRLDVAQGEALVRGVAEGCRQAGCALAGGETAEMPGVYEGGRFDLAGFCVGAVERGHLLPRRGLAAGDRLLGLASSGAHANGYSLIRALVEDYGLDLSEACPFDANETLGAALLKPTRIYAASVLPPMKAGQVKAAAHITGGGLAGNVPRVLPGHLQMVLDVDAWPRPPVFRWLQELGKLEEDELLRTFNAGIGYVLIVGAADVDSVRAQLEQAGETVFTIGHLEETSR